VSSEQNRVRTDLGRQVQRLLPGRSLQDDVTFRLEDALKFAAANLLFLYNEDQGREFVADGDRA
jgi:hypothetical protein